MSKNDSLAAAVAAYGIDLLGCALADFVLQGVLVRSEGPDSLLARAVGVDRKGKASAVLCLAGIGLTFVERWLGLAVYVLVALLWFIPDRRVERTVAASDEQLADD